MISFNDLNLAPQVGVSQRIFIVWVPHSLSTTVKALPDTVYINPIIGSTSEDKYPLHEACLSVPGKL